jgi:soluble lytic murein transglycosylase-like protein
VTAVATGLMQLTKGAVDEVNRVRNTSYSHDEMTNAALNIEVGNTYVDILMKRSHGKLATALDKFGTGPCWNNS